MKGRVLPFVETLCKQLDKLFVDEVGPFGEFVDLLRRHGEALQALHGDAQALGRERQLVEHGDPAPDEEKQQLTRTWLAMTAALALCGAAFAQDFPKYGDEIYQPRLRQHGKDVMWIPTPDAMVTKMLEAAKTTRFDTVYDLGAGEGRIPIAAARQFGARAIGIEYDGKLAALAKRNAERAGVADKVTIIEGDIFKEDFSKATVVTLYLLPDLNYQLRPQLLAMKPGTRIVSHMWDMGEWEPDEAFNVEGSEAFLWIVPAKVEGRWSLRDDKSWEGEIAVTQQFQRIGGTIAIRGKTQPILGAYVNGATMGFSFVDSDGAIRSARMQVNEGRILGQLRFVGNITLVTGRKL